MFSFFKRRAFFIVLGLVLLALFVWFAGPYFAFADIRPLESESARLIAIALIVGLWALSALIKWLRAAKASGRLMAGIMKQSPRDADRPGPDAVQLRERFEEAIAILTQKRKGAQSLYELPWYVFIGAPGSGKTTALVNSGLKFPLEQKSGRGALRGVGGTRNCDWLFADEAVFLDTAGRYTTQDSDAAADSAGWEEFLTLLRTYRERRPINGIILTISAQDLMTHGHAEREAHVEAVRRRLDELTRHLRMQLPVYLMVTKCDLVAGFSEYFDDLARDGRSQVWGTTFSYDATIAGQAAQAVPEEFDALVTRLNARVFSRLEEERDVRRRTRIFGFPLQFAALRESLAEFVTEVFASSRFDRQVLLRGVYFTSGTQEGTPIDRLLGAIGRRFAVAPELVAPASGRGKAYFIEKTLKDVILAESGLAGVNRRVEMRKAAFQLGAYAAIGLVAVLGLIALSVSYNRNRAYLGEVAAVVNRLGPVPVQAASIDALLPRLEAVREVDEAANRYRDHTPLTMRWGLFQGRSVGKTARDTYVLALGDALLPLVAQQLRERLSTYAAEPEKLYEYLKAYLMLGDPRRLNKDHLAFLVKLEWENTYETQPEVAALLQKHFQSLLEGEDLLRPMPLDGELVARARSTILRASVPALIYSRLRLNHAGDSTQGLRLDVKSGLGAERVLTRKSGRSLSEPLPSLYTAEVFKEITSKDSTELVKEFAADSWVWGESGPSISDPRKLAADVLDLYERDYIAAWDGVLSDIGLAPAPDLADALAILARPTSPLRGFLQTVDAQTFLVKPPDPTEPTGVLSSAQKLAATLGAKAKGAVGIATTAAPGAMVTRHFAPIHQLVAGAAGSTPLDPVLDRIGQIQKQLMLVGSGAGQTLSLEALADPQLRTLIRTLQDEAETLPPAVAAIVGEIGNRTSGAVSIDAAGELGSRYQQAVVRECTAVIAGKYPFTPGSATDVAPDDFGRLFGYGGVFDVFFNTNLQKLVDTSRTPWSWRPGSVGGSPAMLRQFERAQRLREVFFRPGSQKPEVSFQVTPTALDQSATRLLLEIDGKSLDYRHGPERTVALTWPGAPPGMAAVSFEALTGPPVNRVFNGPWGWFRLIDVFQMPMETDRRFALRLEMGGHSARVRVESTSIYNPYGQRDWRQFRCGD